MKKVLKTVVRAVAASQSDDIVPIRLGKTPEKEMKRLRKMLKNSPKWSFEDGIVYNVYGFSAPGIAAWRGMLCVQLKGCEHRFRLLSVDRNGSRTMYAIPVRAVDRLQSLPGMDLGAAGLKMLLDMADALRCPQSDREDFIRVKHPAAECVAANTAAFRKGQAREAELVELLETQPQLLPVVIAAMDAQLRALKRCDSIPHFAYNFIPNAGDAQAVKWLIDVFRAVTFSNSAAGAIELTLREASDLETWRGCPDRLVVLKTASGSLLRPIITELEKRDKIEKCGGILPPPLPTVPIAVSRSVFNCPHTYDVALDKEPQALRVEEMDLLRWAMAQVLTKETAEEARSRWTNLMAHPCSYRWERREIWRSVLIRLLHDAWFRDSENRARAEALFSTRLERQHEEEQKRRELITKALQLISTPTRYEREIIERPATKAEAERALEDEAVAFWYRPAKGEYAGKKLIAFSKKSLLRLLQRVSVGEVLYDAVLDACENAGLLNQKNQTINLGGTSFCGVTFFAEK